MRPDLSSLPDDMRLMRRDAIADAAVRAKMVTSIASALEDNRAEGFRLGQFRIARGT
jgi:hypothetical protein